MKLRAIALALVATGCASSKPIEMPYIAPAPSELVFTGQESCETLQVMSSRAHGDEVIFGSQVAAKYPSRGFRAFFTLGMSNLEFNALVRTVARARGDKLALREEMVRRGCLIVLPSGVRPEDVGITEKRTGPESPPDSGPRP